MFLIINMLSIFLEALDYNKISYFCESDLDSLYLFIKNNL